MRARVRLSFALATGVCFTVIALPVQAIDAARSLRPMVYISDKPKAPSNDDGRDRALQSSTTAMTGKTAGAVSSVASGKPAAVAPGAVVTNTASGKPFVPVKANSNCSVSAGAGDLEAQLRACAGIKSGSP